MRRFATFHAIATSGGITAAARRLGKVPSAVHHDLAQLEKAVGQPLFDRVGRGLRLTARGTAFAEAIARSLRTLDAAYGVVLDPAPRAAPLRIGAVSGFGRYRLAPALFTRVPADRPVALVFGTHDELLAQLAANAIDLAVTYRPVVTAPIRSVALGTEDIALFAPAGRAVRLDTLAAERFVTYDESDYVFAHWFATVLGDQPHRLITGDHTAELEEALASVAAGRGLTIAPCDAAPPLVAAGRLARIPTPIRATNVLFLLGIGGALDGADAALVRACVAEG